MAESRNIKELPQSDAMAAGDYFLIETPAGTQLLDFLNFVIDQDNTTFAADIQSNITTLSGTMETLSAGLDMNNSDSPIYIVNTSLSAAIDTMNTSLYGAEFSTFLEESRASLPDDPQSGEPRVLDNNMQTLSALIHDSLYSQLTSEILKIRGASDITDRDWLVYTGAGATKAAPENNPGGLLGVVMDTALASVDVFTMSLEDEITFGKDSVTFSVKIPSKYAVHAGSLQYNIRFTGSADALTRTDETPYTNSGTFAVSEFTRGAVEGGDQSFAWTIKRFGGKAFSEMIVETEVMNTDQSPNQAPTVSVTDDEGNVTTIRNPDYVQMLEVTTDDRTSFPIGIGARLVVGLNTAEVEETG